MWQIATFWLLLGVPGFAVLWRRLPNALEGGVLSAIVMSYLASFVLLSPVSMLGYAFGLPLRVLGAVVVALVAVSLGWLLRELVRVRPHPRPSAIGVLVLLLIATDMLMGLRSGGFFFGDADYHMARVRVLLDHGFKSWDPLVAGHRLDPTYHSNLYHALIAVGAQLGGQHAPEAWTFTLPFAKLLCACATYHLALTLLGRRWLAWCAAAMFTLYQAPLSVLLYPNTLAAYGLLPLALAFVVEAASERHGLRPALGLAALSVVLVQVHALYYVFACIVAGPVLCVLLARAWQKRSARRRELLVALLALGLGAPWFGVKYLPRLQAVAHAQPPADAGAPADAGVRIEPPADKQVEDKPVQPEVGFVSVGKTQLMLDPRSLLDVRGTNLQALLALLLGLWSQRRQQFVTASLALAVVAALLFVPPLCTLIVHAAGAQWIARRLSVVFASTHHALVPGVLFLLLAEHVPQRFGRLREAGIQALALLSAMATAYTFGVNGARWTRAVYLGQARDLGHLRKQLRMHAARREIFARNVPSEAIVGVAPSRVYDLVVDCDCYPLSLPPKRGTRGVDDMGARRSAANDLLSPATAFERRLEILKRYDVRHVYYRYGRRTFGLPRAYRRITEKIIHDDADVLIVLDPARLRAHAWRGKSALVPFSSQAPPRPPSPPAGGAESVP